MNVAEASKEACKQPTLVEALTWIAIWESERIVRQARENETWETCFRVCFERVMKDYSRGAQAA
jgi:hypothetical protein